jgi:hypothetical protein
MYDCIILCNALHSKKIKCNATEMQPKCNATLHIPWAARDSDALLKEVSKSHPSR